MNNYYLLIINSTVEGLVRFGQIPKGKDRLDVQFLWHRRILSARNFRYERPWLFSRLVDVRDIDVRNGDWQTSFYE